MEGLYDELLVELECPVCTNYMTPPIRQCETGHSICQACRKKLPMCPLCQKKFTDSKNIALEALAGKLYYPCVNKDAGCKLKLSLDQKEEHERLCSYFNFKCAMPSCDWSGKMEEISKHWESKKITSKPYTETNVCHTKIKPDSYYVNFLKAFGKSFWFKCRTTTDSIFWAIQYIGKPEDAKNYFYEIEIFKAGEPKRKVIIGDYCLGIEASEKEIFNESDCLSVPLKGLGRYVGDDLLMIYYTRVRFIPKKDEASGGENSGEQQKQKKQQEKKKQYEKKQPNEKKQSKEGQSSDSKKSSENKKSTEKKKMTEEDLKKLLQGGKKLDFFDNL